MVNILLSATFIGAALEGGAYLNLEVWRLLEGTAYLRTGPY